MLGQELEKVFSKDGDYEVIAWDKDEIDISDKKQVNFKIAELKPDIIINAAAYNAVDKIEESEEEYESAKKINGLAPGYLAAAASEAKAAFVHYSTDYVFNGIPEISEPQGCSHSCSGCTLHEGFTLTIGFAEDAKPDPISNYGKSKLMGEMAVEKKSRKGNPYYIIRLSKLFGSAGVSKQAKKSFFDVMFELGVDPSGEKKGIRAVDEESGCFTYAPDLAKKTKEIVESKKPSGIYHVTNAGSATWYEAAVEMYEQAGIKTKIIPVTADEFPRPAARPYISTLINTKLNPMRGYKEALAEYLEKKKRES